MSHTWNGRDPAARSGLEQRRRIRTQRRKLASALRPLWTESDVRRIVEQLRAEGIELPRVRDDAPRAATGEPRYVAIEGEA